MLWATPWSCEPLMPSVEVEDTSPGARPVIFVPFMFSPEASNTWPLVRVRLSAVRAGVVATVMSVPVRVTAMFWPFRNCTVPPGATLVAVSPFACRFQPALATSPISLSWLTFTASVPPTPGATLVMVLPPALIPAVVMLGPPVMVSPSVVIEVPPTVTELKLGSATTP